MSWPRCPRCKRDSVFCIDSRATVDRTRRRYACKTRKCKHRFTTLEEIVAGRKGVQRGRGVGSIVQNTKDALMARIDKLLDKELAIKRRK